MTKPCIVAKQLTGPDLTTHELKRKEYEFKFESCVDLIKARASTLLEMRNHIIESEELADSVF